MSRNDRKRGGVEEHLSLAEAAERMGISERTARRWIKSGKLRAYKPGRDYWIPESALTELVEESEVHPKALTSSQPSFDGLLEERRIAIPYEVCRYALESFCNHWQPALSGKRRLDRQGFEDFKADAASLYGLTRVVMGVEMEELGGQHYDEEGDPVFYTERSEFGPAIVRFHDLAIRMERIGKERFGEDLTSDPEMGQLINLFPKAS
jgi:excisionase family DNA binding protein